MPGISEKYFRYRDSPAKLRIEHDLYCTSCGYNVRGLLYGRNCPECGTMIEAPAQGASGDPLLSGSTEERRRWQLGLGLAALCALQLLVVRVVAFVGLVLAGSRALVAALLVSGGAAAVLWLACGWLLTPDSLDTRWPKDRPLRLAARYLQWGWPLGSALLALRVYGGFTADMASVLNAISLGLRGLGGLGVLLLVMLLQRVARDAELEKVDTRFTTVLWLLPIVAAVSALLPPIFTWIAAILIFFLVILPWTWLMLWLTLGFYGMYQHVTWGLRLAADRHDRAQRIAEARRELDDAANASIRPVRPTEGEVPLDPESRSR